LQPYRDVICRKTVEKTACDCDCEKTVTKKQVKCDYGVVATADVLRFKKKQLQKQVKNCDCKKLVQKKLHVMTLSHYD
jgi:hypothetical protein